MGLVSKRTELVTPWFSVVLKVDGGRRGLHRGSKIDGLRLVYQEIGLFRLRAKSGALDDKATNLKSTQISNNSGEYVFAQIVPGPTSSPRWSGIKAPAGSLTVPRRDVSEACDQSRLPPPVNRNSDARISRVMRTVSTSGRKEKQNA
jgi:hypothetical protein